MPKLQIIQQMDLEVVWQVVPVGIFMLLLLMEQEYLTIMQKVQHLQSERKRMVE